MKLCYLADGKSIHTRRWLEWFASHGHEVVLLTDSPGEGWDKIGVTQHLIGKKEANKLIHYLYCVKDIKKFIHYWQPDILHGHFISGYGFWAHLSEFHPYILTAWGSDIYIIPHQKAISRLLTIQALKKADLVTADSLNLIEEIKHLQPECNQIELIRFGVDTALFKPAEDKISLRDKLGWESATIFITNRRLEPLYQVDKIVNSFIEAARINPSIQLIILHTGSEETHLKEMVQQANMGHAIQFRGEITHQELPQYLAAADFYISYPKSDSTSASLLEAMAAGLPIITSELPSNQEWLQQGVNGWLVPLDRPDLLTQSLHTAMSLSSTEKVHMGERNRLVVLEKAQFTLEMAKMEKLYQSLL
jgi:glycosyltransferase involved in cell wall biosynthesis